MRLRVVQDAVPAPQGEEPSSRTPHTLDSAGNVGLYTAIAIGTNGNPIIRYYDNTNDGLKRYRCGVRDCSWRGTGRDRGRQ